MLNWFEFMSCECEPENVIEFIQFSQMFVVCSKNVRFWNSKICWQMIELEDLSLSLCSAPNIFHCFCIFFFLEPLPIGKFQFFSLHFAMSFGSSESFRLIIEFFRYPNRRKIDGTWSSGGGGNLTPKIKAWLDSRFIHVQDQKDVYNWSGVSLRVMSRRDPENIQSFNENAHGDR